MKRIALNEIEQKLHAESYEQLCMYVYKQKENGSFKPVKASGTNGKKPALYYEYWLTDADKITNDYEYEEELKYKMTTQISVDYYLRHLQQYADDREWVMRLNNYFLNLHGAKPEIVSKNERSFQIWGREKFLQQEQGKKILKRCGVALSQLSYYETSEPLAYYSRHRQTRQSLPICQQRKTRFFTLGIWIMKESVFMNVWHNCRNGRKSVYSRLQKHMKR